MNSFKNEPDERLIFDVADGIEHSTSFSEGYIPLLICAPTGVFWKAQANHCHPSHPIREGYVIPFYNYQYDEEGVHNECDYLQELEDNDKKIVIDKINNSLERYSDSIIERICFDDERKCELMEGWIPVNVYFKYHLNEPIMTASDAIMYVFKHAGFCLKKGYLCPWNCD